MSAFRLPRSLLAWALVFSLQSMLARAQSVALPWSGHGHDPQHSALSPVASQPLDRIRWQTPVDLDPQLSGTSLLIHYGSPLITRQNTVIVPVKTGATGGFRIEARAGATGALLWTETTDYALPPHNWIPPCGPALTPKNRVWFPGAGGTVLFRDTPDAATGATGRVAFYGLANYEAAPAAFDASVRISTPITADRYGNIFFGFEVAGATAPALQSGLARIAEDGTGTWVAASTAASDPAVAKVVMNCAPALSNDHKTLYVAVRLASGPGGYLTALDSRTLAPLAEVRLKDVLSPANDARLLDDGTATPTVGPDGDVYYGTFEYTYGTNHYRGWLQHFDATLTQTKTPGGFGWDTTASIVPASLVSSYQGTSPYLLLTKYNNYAGVGGGGLNKMAILDPHATMTDPQTGATVMNEVLSILAPTPDPKYPGVPGAVREWCVNTVAVDPIHKCASIQNEDGKIYRWDFATNTFTQTLTLTAGIREAYTPSVIGVDGTVYVITNSILFAVGQ